MPADLLLQRLWYTPASHRGWLWILWLLLWPLSVLFCLTAWLRRTLFRVGVLQVKRVTKPVVVIGNLTVGGTGKTPLTIWLAQQLHARGLRVGIITRGYGGNASTWPQRVNASCDPQQVGDEAVLLATETQAIVCAGPDRVAAANLAIAAGAELILSDDGLQHYRLHRDLECVVIDGARGLGNCWRLPAGPLRESVHRLRSVQAVLVNDRSNVLSSLVQQGPKEGGNHSSHLPSSPPSPRPSPIKGREISGDVLSQIPTSVLVAHYSLRIVGLSAATTDDTQSALTPLATFAGQTVHVVTGIGHPEAFVKALQSAGLQTICHTLPDHATFRPQDITFADELPVIMTSKDAVKCRAFAGPRHWQAVAEVQMAANDAERLLSLVQAVASRAI